MSMLTYKLLFDVFKGSSTKIIMWKNSTVCGIRAARFILDFQFRRNASRYQNLKEAPPIEVFHLTQLFNQDKSPNKVNLGVGAYRTGEGRPWVLPVVRKAEMLMAKDDRLNKEYLPVLGLPAFTEAATKLMLTENSPALKQNKAFGVQSLGGTGGLRVAAEFLSNEMCYDVFFVSKPTWGNHNNIFTGAGFGTKREYTYWDPVNRNFNIHACLKDLKVAPENAVIIFHTCAHNPTGIDPTPDEWKKIASVVQERKLFPIFDTAYQGFASGDLMQDGWAARYFVEQGIECIICQSFSKNVGLYCERIGNVIFVVNDSSVLPKVKSQVTKTIRRMYSNPPNHGARVVATILNDQQLHCEWLEALLVMACRIKRMRQALRDQLEKLKSPGSWEHITNQIGMFSYTGLNEAQSIHMVKKHHVYMLKSGRINMCGITPNNVDHVAKAIHDSITNVH